MERGKRYRLLEDWRTDDMIGSASPGFRAVSFRDAGVVLPAGTVFTFLDMVPHFDWFKYSIRVDGRRHLVGMGIDRAVEAVDEDS